MKKSAFGLALSLLLLANLTACGAGLPGSGGMDGASSGLTDLPVQTLEDSSAPESEKLPDASQAPESENLPDTSQAPEQDAPADNQTPDKSGGSAGNRSGGKSSEGSETLAEDGWYTSKEEVALYIHLYDRLPGNYVTKDEAEQAGWSGGSVERYTGAGTAIGGGRFGNREGLLPKEKGRTYTECDIDTPGKDSRGAKRIVFSNDGLIYYTGDHYESFELLYGEP